METEFRLQVGRTFTNELAFLTYFEVFSYHINGSSYDAQSKRVIAIIVGICIDLCVVILSSRVFRVLLVTYLSNNRRLRPRTQVSNGINIWDYYDSRPNEIYRCHFIASILRILILSSRSSMHFLKVVNMVVASSNAKLSAYRKRCHGCLYVFSLGGPLMITEDSSKFKPNLLFT